MSKESGRAALTAVNISAAGSIGALRGPIVAGRYAHIDALRAFAVLLVVIAHTNIGGIPGGSGVTIFFTISGFIITHILLREKATTGTFSIRGFYWRRFLKLAPPFLVIIAIPTVVYSVWNPISWTAFAAQILFVFNWVEFLPISPVLILPGSSVLWSLAVEEQFYIVFAVLWLVIVRSQNILGWLAGLGVVCAVGSLTLRIVYSLNGVSSERIYGGTETRLDAIAIGILAAVIYSQFGKANFGRLRVWLGHDSVPFIAVAFYLLSLVIRDEFFRDTIRYSIQSLATAAFILYGLIPTNSLFRRFFTAAVSMRVIQIVGLSSYSMYLIHKPLMRLLEPTLDSWPTALRVGVLVAVGIGGGILAWRIIERPVERWKHRKPKSPAKFDRRGNTASRSW